jgi:hypothetical protein
MEAFDRRHGPRGLSFAGEVGALTSDPIVEPADGFANMFAFYEPTVDTATPTTDGAELSQLLDLSGQVNTLTQSNASLRPLLDHDGPNGYWCVDLDGQSGVSKYLQHTGGLDGGPAIGGYLSAFIVARVNQTYQNSRGIFEVFGTGYTFSAGTTLGQWYVGGDYGNNYLGDFAVGEWTTLSYCVDGSNMRMHINGVLVATLSPQDVDATLTRLRMGNPNTTAPPISIASMAICGVEDATAVYEWHRYVVSKFNLSHVEVP